VQIFKDNEKILFWLLMLELIASALGAVACIGVSRFTTKPIEIEKALEFPVGSSRASFKASPIQAAFNNPRSGESLYFFSDQDSSKVFRLKMQASGAQIWKDSRYLKHISNKKLDQLGELTYDKIEALL
jgi:hypothetical protein